MKNPKEEIRDYLNILIGRFFYIKNLDSQLKILKEWESPKRIEAIDVGSHIFGLISYSFQRTILIELCIYLSKREKKSLSDFLVKAEENADVTEVHNIDARQYKLIIQEHRKQLEKKDNLIARIKTIRNKNIAHADEAFFKNPNDIYKKYPIHTSETDELLDIISNILKDHHIYLFGRDMDMVFRTSSGIEAILIYTRAYKRIWEDDRLRHINRSIYSEDDYNTTDSICS